MSFTWFADAPLRTKEQIAREVHAVSLSRGLDELATVIALMTIATEVGANGQWWCPANRAAAGSSGFPYDSLSDDGRSVGYFQQQTGPSGEPWWGPVADEMTLSKAADNFLDRLDDSYGTAANNPALAGQFAQRVQGSAFPDRYSQHWDEAWSVLRAALAGQQPAPLPDTDPTPPAPQEAPQVADRPDFNEYGKWTQSSQSRNGKKPTLFLLHTQEGPGNADSLADFLDNPANEVSYHYTISTGYPNDDGVTVVDVVNTDDAAWSVGDANNYSINLCFAGSYASWSRQDWITRAGRAIDVAAYLAVQDCKRYGIPLQVIGFGGKYSNLRAGVADHRYVTDVIGWGTHTDVGVNFPGDLFTASFIKYAGSTGGGTQPIPEQPAPPAQDPFVAFLKAATDRQLLEYIAAQLGPGDPAWASKGKTLRDKVFGV